MEIAGQVKGRTAERNRTEAYGIFLFRSAIRPSSSSHHLRSSTVERSLVVGTTNIRSGRQSPRQAGRAAPPWCCRARSSAKVPDWHLRNVEASGRSRRQTLPPLSLDRLAGWGTPSGRSSGRASARRLVPTALRHRHADPRCCRHRHRTHRGDPGGRKGSGYIRHRRCEDRARCRKPAVQLR